MSKTNRPTAGPALDVREATARARTRNPDRTTSGNLNSGGTPGIGSTTAADEDSDKQATDTMHERDRERLARVRPAAIPTKAAAMSAAGAKGRHDGRPPCFAYLRKPWQCRTARTGAKVLQATHGESSVNAMWGPAPRARRPAGFGS